MAATVSGSVRDEVAAGGHRADDVRRQAGALERGTDHVDAEVADLLEGQLDRVEPEARRSWSSSGSIVASVRGEAQTQVLMPMARTTAPSRQRWTGRPATVTTVTGRSISARTQRSCQASGKPGRSSPPNFA